MKYTPSNKILYYENSIINGILFIRETEPKRYKDKACSVIRKGLFRCFCGNEFVSPIHSIFKNETKSCGCTKGKKISESRTKHGLSNTPTYTCWNSMKNRCYCENNIQFKDYGGRGIIVYEGWKNSFSIFLQDMGERPGKEYSIDRINVNGNYEPGNCRWATAIEQANNKRDNVYLECEGVTKTLTEWSRIANIHRVTLKYRLWKGMSIKEAISTPADERFVYKNKIK